MAQGDAFQLGVWVPLGNHNFREFDQWAFLESAATAGAMSFEIVDEDGNAIPNWSSPAVLAEGMTLILGPNSSGHWETVTIQAVDNVGGKTITATSALLYSYSANDRVTIRSIPLDWTPLASSYVASRKYERSDPMPYGGGALDWNAGYAAKITRLVSGAAYVHRIHQYGPIGSFLNANGVHRFSAWGKGSGDTTKNEIELYSALADNSTTGAVTTLSFSGSTSWAFKSATVTPEAAASLAWIYAQIDSGVTGLTTFEIDNIILEHAHNTDDAASGFYTFTEYNDQGTIRFLEEPKRTESNRLNNSIGFYSPANGRVRTGFSCEFTETPQAFRDNLRILKNYCDTGNHLVLRANLDDIPDVLIVDMSITNPGKGSWDLSSGDLSITFRQVL